MPELNERGLSISTFTENKEKLSEEIKSIYGEDINIDANSPDGQFISIFSQAKTDLEELLLGIWNSLNPDKATGVSLDRVFAFNGIRRKAGTYTYVNEEFTFSNACTLKGIEEDGVENAYTIRDNEGNKFLLVNRHEQPEAGTVTLLVRAEKIGKIEVLPNTINTPVTVILGVSAVNNPFPAVSVGINEETDFEFRNRRNLAIYAASKGFDESMKSALLNLPDVTYAEVYDNRYGDYSSFGVPLHGIWAVVEGGGDKEIANTIFTKLTAGVPMFGSEEIYVNDSYGKSNVIKFSRVVQQNLYVNGNLKSVSGKPFVVSDIISYIVSNYKFQINQIVTSNDIICLVEDYNKNNGTDVLATNVKVSNDNIAWQDFVAPSNIINRFEMSEDTISFEQV